MIMAVLISLSIALFTSLLSSFTNYSSVLRQELDLASELMAEEKVNIDASFNGTHVLISLTNRASREVVFPYIVFKHGDEVRVEKLDLRVRPCSSSPLRVPVSVPQGFANPSFSVTLVAKRGSIYTFNFALPQGLTSNASTTPYVKLPYDDMCLINDVDVADRLKGIVVASYQNGGVLAMDVDDGSVLWSKEFPFTKAENVAFSEALNATVLSVSSDGNNPKALSIIALRDGKLLSINNFYSYYSCSQASYYVEERTYQPAIVGRNQQLIVVPESYFSAQYYPYYAWTIDITMYANFAGPRSPSVGKVKLQRAVIGIVDTQTSFQYYLANPDIFPKFKVLGYAPINESFGVLLVSGALYQKAVSINVERCSNVKTLILPTLHAINNGNASWYLSINPCDISGLNTLTNIGKTIVVASGPYLHVVSAQGKLLRLIDYSPQKIVLLKRDCLYNKLILGLSNGTMIVLNESLSEEKRLALSKPSQIVDAVLMQGLRLVVFNETHALDLENPTYAVRLPSKPYKAVALDAWRALVATPSGLLLLRV
jgi:hypothetical protein